MTFARFTYPFEAWLFKGLLESRGLAAFIADEHLITMQWMWEIALGGVKVQVMTHELDTAQEVLAHFYGWWALVITCWSATGVVFPLPSAFQTYPPHQPRKKPLHTFLYVQ